MNRRAPRCAVLAALALTACGGASKKSGDKAQLTPLPPVSADALRSFDSAMRALRLGGPNANDKAVGRLEAALEAAPDLWEAWYNLGVIYLRQGENEQAARAFDKALHTRVGYGPAQLGRAEAKRRLGNTKSAVADYEAALIDTSDAQGREISARLASLLRSEGQYEDALDALRGALRKHGESARVYVELGLVYRAQGRDELAALVLAKAVALDDKEPSAYNALALLALDGNEAQIAFDHFDKATALDPKYVDARFNKALVLLDAGDYLRAKKELLVVVRLLDTDTAAQVALGVAHRGLAEYDQAQDVWEKLANRAPRSNPGGDALFNLAVLQMDFRENEDAARAALDRYLQDSAANHPRRQQAKERKKDLGL